MIAAGFFFYSSLFSSRPLLRIGSALTTGGMLPSSSFLNPRICPTSPPGFGMGHSLRRVLSFPELLVVADSSSLAPPLSEAGSPVVICFDMIVLLFSSTWHLRRRLFARVDSASGSAESASARVSTGQGRMCGVATTRKEMKRVVVKREVVRRERGWRAGGMVGEEAADAMRVVGGAPSGKALEELIG